MSGIRTDCYWADVDCNNQVNIVDVMRVAAHCQAQRGQWNYSRVYDANDDNVVDATDLQLFAAEWGLMYP